MALTAVIALVIVLRQQHRDQIRELQLVAAKLNESASAALNNISQSLQSANRQQMETIINPLQQRIAEFRKAVNEAYISDNASRKSLSMQVDRLMNLNMGLSREAHELAEALRGNSKVQGDWGEMVLEKLLQSAGLQKDIHYRVQPTADQTGHIYRDDNYSLQRPDVIVNLPEERSLVIDSKVSLTAYTEMCAAQDDEDLRAARKKHVASVKKHIDELAEKKYQNVVKDSALQVMMFIPNDGAYMTAVTSDTSLYNYALHRKVALVSPAHLYSIVLLIEQLWSRDKQNKNAEMIAKTGGLLYDSIVKFTDEFEKAERLLNQSVATLSSARHTMYQGSKSISARASRLRDLGAKTTRTLKSD